MVAAVLAVLAVLGGLAVALQGDEPSSRREEVTEQAERFALELSSYNYRTIDRDLADVRAMGVGNFRYQFAQVMGGTAFPDAIRKSEQVATAKVLRGPYLASLTDNDARTFTVLEQTLQGKGQTQPQTRRVRVESILVRTTEGWRVDWVEIT